MNAGDSFGENAINGTGRRNATVACITDVELLVLSRDSFSQVMVGFHKNIGTWECAIDD